MTNLPELSKEWIDAHEKESTKYDDDDSEGDLKTSYNQDNVDHLEEVCQDNDHHLDYDEDDKRRILKTNCRNSCRR
jgi:hypothetical protein